jgi:hypothetical protein
MTFRKFIGVWILVLIVGALAVGGALSKPPSESTKPEHKITIEEYKTTAKIIPYEQMARHPEDYLKTIVKFEGKVVQAGDGFMRIDVNAHVAWIDRANAGLSDNAIVYVSYRPKSNERVLEADKVRFWGRFDGIISYKAVLGQTISVPNINAGIVEDDGPYPIIKPKPLVHQRLLK